MNLEPLRDKQSLERGREIEVRKVETVTIESLMQEPGEPIWRTIIDDICHDFDTQDEAWAFALAHRSAALPDLLTEITRQREVIEAWHDIDRKRDAEVERLKTALEPFVSGYSHTSVFLSSRQKMHPAGQDLYRDDVERAIAALKEPSHED